MKKLVTSFLLFLGGILLLSSCNSDNSPIRTKITGKAGELVIVIPSETWKGPVGSQLQHILAQPQLGLPQDEPIFDLINIPPDAFKKIFRTSRNIINVRISPTQDSSKVELKKDVWAWPQAVVNIQVRSEQDFQKLFSKNSDKIVSFLLSAERKRLMQNYKNYPDKAVRNILLKDYKFSLNVPPGFVIPEKTKTKDFAWIRYETPEISQGILVHIFPYTSDSTFTRKFMWEKQDSVMHYHVPGPRDGSFMITEPQLPPTFQVFKFKNNYAAMMRGLWKVQNDFMGGPFVTLSVLDAANSRVIMLTGYVYAPRYNKRNYLRQVEAMLYSLTLPDQKKNNKINSQVEMGN